MAEFELKRYGRSLTGRFRNNADPFDEDECVDLLKRTAKTKGVKPEETELIAYPKGKAPIPYRA